MHFYGFALEGAYAKRERDSSSTHSGSSRIYTLERSVESKVSGLEWDEKAFEMSISFLNNYYKQYIMTMVDIANDLESLSTVVIFKRHSQKFTRSFTVNVKIVFNIK